MNTIFEVTRLLILEDKEGKNYDILQHLFSHEEITKTIIRDSIKDLNVIGNFGVNFKQYEKPDNFEEYKDFLGYYTKEQPIELGEIKTNSVFIINDNSEDTEIVFDNQNKFDEEVKQLESIVDYYKVYLKVKQLGKSKNVGKTIYSEKSSYTMV